MSVDYSTANLITSVKIRTMNADNQNLITDSNVVRIASEELQSVIIPYITSVKQEYWVTVKDDPFVQGQVNYEVPQRASGAKYRDVCLVDNQGNEVLLNYIQPEDMKSSWAYAPYQFGFYPQDNHIVLVLGNLLGAANYSYVRLTYFRRPNQLCTTDEAGQVVSINSTTKEVTLSFAPSAWTTADTFDCIASAPPFSSHGDDQTVTAINGFILTFTSIPTNLTVGDWVSLANTSPIPQIPVEAHRLLETLTAARVLQYMGDPAYQVAQAQAEDIKRNMIQVLAPRVDGSPAKLPLRNRLWGWF
jgi:hypothetical protein